MCPAHKQVELASFHAHSHGYFCNFEEIDRRSSDYFAVATMGLLSILKKVKEKEKEIRVLMLCVW